MLTTPYVFEIWRHRVESERSKKTHAMQTLWDNVDFKTRAFTRDKGGHFIMIKESIHQGHIIIINVYTTNNRASKYRKQG